MHMSGFTGQNEAADTQLIYRHSLVVRATHWINALCLLVLLMSGLQIFNAHPSLYFGDRSDPGTEILSIGSKVAEDGTASGITTIGGSSFRTTGVLGVSRASDGELIRRAFPSWLTLPSYQDLATGRRWHFFVAWLFVINGLVYLLHSLLSGHARRDLVPSSNEIKGIGHDILQHLRFRFPRGEEATRYNVLQKLAYLGIVFVVLPITILAGLTLSPALNAAFPFMLDLFGGRQSARTVHFIGANVIFLFAIVHIFMVLVTGVWNNLRSMVTGLYRIDGEGTGDGK